MKNSKEKRSPIYGNKRRSDVIRAGIVLELALFIAFGSLFFDNGKQTVSVTGNTKSDYIKWVDFNVSYEALCKAYEYDVDTYGKEIHLDWIELLAYTAARGGGTFGSTSVSEMKKIAEKILSGETTMQAATADMKDFSYYKEAYSAVLGGMVGEYEVKNDAGKYEKRYGLKAFSPIAKGFEYSDYDDFGVSRTYGFKREHLGHDMMGQVGVPIRI